MTWHSDVDIANSIDLVKTYGHSLCCSLRGLKWTSKGIITYASSKDTLGLHNVTKLKKTLEVRELQNLANK